MRFLRDLVAPDNLGEGYPQITKACGLSNRLFAKLFPLLKYYGNQPSTIFIGASQCE